MTEQPKLPATFNRLAWSNLAAQSAEQVALAAAPIVAVLALGAGEGETGLLQTALEEPVRAVAKRRHPWQEISEGAAFVFRHALLLPVFVTQFIFNTAWFVILAVFVPYAVHRLGLSASGVGTTLAMYGVGMI